MAQRKSTKTSKQHADLQEKRNTLARRIQQWREVQLAYMPSVAVMIVRAGGATGSADPDVASPSTLPENTPLYLPSALSVNVRTSMDNIVKKELRLRMAQADEALEDVRRGRRMITGLVQFKKLNISGAGNRPNTRMRTLYNRLQLRIQRAADRYRTARDALLVLDPNGLWQEKFRKLNTADIRGPGRQEDDPVHRTNNRYEMSWIWQVVRDSARDGNVEQEETFDETMRAEWAKMKARQDRWEEEYQLVQEEMRRIVAYLEWKADWWNAQAERRVALSAPLAEGVRAYALRQSSLMITLAASSVRKWIGALTSEGISVSWASKYVVWSGSVVSDGDGSSESPITHVSPVDREGENKVDDEKELLEEDGEEEEEEDDDARFDRYDLDD